MAILNDLIVSGPARFLSPTFISNTLIIDSKSIGAWNEGIRINETSAGWATLTLGGPAGSIKDTGPNVWSLHTRYGNFILAKNGADTFDIGLTNTSGAWTIKGSSSNLAILNINNIGSTNSWIYLQSSGTNKGSVGYYSGFSCIANETSMGRIGVNDSGVPQYWSSSNSSTAQTLIHSGNISSYAAGSATLLKPTDNTSTITAAKSSWAANSSNGKIVWREAFKESSYGTDTGDIVLWVNKNTAANGTELNMTIDGNFYAEQNKLVLHSGNYSTYCAPAYTYQTTDPGAGSTLTTGKLLIVYS